MYGVALIAVLIVMGGLIAYLGDLLGRRIGHQRLTLWGLRPRHTSIIITVIGGFVIAGSTLGMLAAASQDVRIALFHIKEIQIELRRSQDQLRQAQEQIRRQQAQVKELTLMIETKSNEYRDIDARLQELMAARHEAEKQLAAARREKERVEQDYERIRASYEATRENLEKVQDALAKEKEQVRQLEKNSKELAETVARLELARDDLNRRLSQLYEELQKVQGDVNRLRQGNVAYRANQIVWAETLTAGGTREEVRQRLYDLLVRADRQAVSRGASLPDRSGSGLKLPNQKMFDDAVEFLAARDGEWVVRVVSKANSLVGEPVVVYFEIIPHRLAFRQDEVIASAVVDPAQGNPEEALLSLLEQANGVAVQRGMITDANGTVGQADGQEFGRALAALRSARGPVRLEARAASDTWTTRGPLQIRLRVVAADDDEGDNP
ncbi:MAG: DUF3084 domain-containing protein [Limnochordales bacterium]|nr:DUF3084 domain-containing protein [Limnochordales bacterium]